MKLPQLAWLLTVIVALIATILLALSSYIGYSIVFLTVAIAAAINVR